MLGVTGARRSRMWVTFPGTLCSCGRRGQAFPKQLSETAERLGSAIFTFPSATEHDFDGSRFWSYRKIMRRAKQGRYWKVRDEGTDQHNSVGRLGACVTHAILVLILATHTKKKVPAVLHRR